MSRPDDMWYGDQNASKLLVIINKVCETGDHMRVTQEFLDAHLELPIALEPVKRLKLANYGLHGFKRHCPVDEHEGARRR